MTSIMIGKLLRRVAWPFRRSTVPGQPRTSDAIADALALIGERGLIAYYCMPNYGSGNDPDLWRALRTLARAGYVVADESGELFGYYVPAQRMLNGDTAKTPRLVRRP